LSQNTKRGCGCALVVLLLFIAAIFALWYFIYRPRESQLPPPSGNELRVHILDVGQGDSILIISPEGKAVLVDAGDTGRGSVVLEALRRHNVNEIDLLIATHAHADHIGAADEVIRGITVRRVLDSGVRPPGRDDGGGGNQNNQTARRTRGGREVALPTTRAYQDYLAAIEERVPDSPERFIRAQPDQRYDIGGGAVITVLAPMEPYFTREQLRSGGNEPNANSVVVRLDYGRFSMLLTGDAEAQTEQRLMERGANIAARVLKVGHHGSRYATSEDFLRRGRFGIAVISNGENNRYGHPSQEVLNRLRAANVRVYRTDLQGEITIRTRGDENFEVTTAREAASDVWTGREAQRDDSSRAGFVAYGDFGPPPRNRNSRGNNNNRSAGR
jgi:competence protein ComEC